jgi:DNA invertase Pin-like site-specific DNA recombinase
MVFRAGIYARLSREDEERGSDQSESIKNQIDYLCRITNENGWSCVDIYTDDGLTGTNFDRPGFQRILKDIENGRINMVITKDLSRLGRDYIQTGYYLEKYFPEKNVRYIAVNDGVDTFSGNSSTEMSPFKNVINDFYARDISKKVRTAVDTRRKSGKFIGSFAPYGYRKDSENKNKLVPDLETSSVVKKIFKLYASGNSLRYIAYLLNSESIPSPAKYKENNTNYKGGRTKNYHWGPESIKVILTNPTYTGNLAQKKCTRINYKSKKYRSIPKEAWTVVKNTHEPIIDDAMFELVQQLLDKKASLYSMNQGNAHLLSGLIYCGDCGSRMTFLRGSGNLTYAVCSKYKRFKMCTRHSFPEKGLNDTVLNELRHIVLKSLDVDKLVKKVKSQTERLRKEYGKDFEKETKACKKRLDEIKKIIKNLYEDKVKNMINEIDFVELSQSYNKERELVYGRLEKLNKDKNKQDMNQLEKDELNNLITPFVNFKSVDKATLVRLISRIEIFEDAQLKISYHFKNPYQG